MSLTLILTPGDPLGIGPEITVKALHRLGASVRVVVVGSLRALQDSARQLGVDLPPESDVISYRAVEDDRPGAVAYRSLELAAQMIAKGEGAALVTGPISKRRLHDAGYDFQGHTEILEDFAHKLFGAPNARAEMLFVYKNFRLLLLTRHIALRNVSEALAAPGAVARPLKTLISFLRRQMKIDEPHIALLGVNPHAGELSGDEEEKHLKPVLHAVNAIGASRLEGPFAADAFFRGFDPANPGYDSIVAAYHDQGLIPFKILAGHEAVNVTIGLPFLRASVSHGTADDIAGQGLAREDSLLAAVRWISAVHGHDADLIA